MDAVIFADFRRIHGIGKGAALHIGEAAEAVAEFEKTALQLHNHVRGMNPWPVATMELQGKRFKVYETAVLPENSGKAPGSVLGITKTGLKIACGEGVIEIRTLQAEGGKRMAAPDYFRGHPLEGLK